MDDLYREVIIDRYKNPRMRGVLDPHDYTYQDDNPLCGDRLTVYVNVRGGEIRDIGFVGNGCAISTASASLMTEALLGKTEQEADALFERFHDLVAGTGRAARGSLGKLDAFAGVREFPVRVKCATLAWHTVRTALHTPGRTASTE